MRFLHLTRCWRWFFSWPKRKFLWSQSTHPCWMTWMLCVARTFFSPKNASRCQRPVISGNAGVKFCPWKWEKTEQTWNEEIISPRNWKASKIEQLSPCPQKNDWSENAQQMFFKALNCSVDKALSFFFELWQGFACLSLRYHPPAIWKRDH